MSFAKQFLFEIRRAWAELGHAIDDVHDQVGTGRGRCGTTMSKGVVVVPSLCIRARADWDGWFGDTPAGE